MSTPSNWFFGGFSTQLEVRSNPDNENDSQQRQHVVLSRWRWIGPNDSFTNQISEQSENVSYYTDSVAKSPAAPIGTSWTCTEHAIDDAGGHYLTWRVERQTWEAWTTWADIDFTDQTTTIGTSP